jgi:hypothetical protein
LGVLVTVRSGGEEGRGVGLDGCCWDTRIAEVVVRARAGLRLAGGEARVRYGARLVVEGETLGKLASAEGAVDLVMCEGERGGMPVGPGQEASPVCV